MTDIDHKTEQPRMRLGEYLLSKGLINEVQLHAALEEQKITQERLGMILVRGGFITASIDACPGSAIGVGGRPLRVYVL